MFDTSGISLQNQEIQWNDEEDPESFDKFVAILNSAMSSNNPFTSPIIQKNVGTIPTEVYAINNQRGQNVAFSFEGSINGEKFPFEIVSADINQNNVFKEAEPMFISQ